MKIGLVLEGGGMRGLYTAGVIDSFIDHGLKPQVICGTSAGVTFGINLPSGQKGRVLRYNTAYVGRKDYVSFYSLITTGNIVNTEFAYDKLPNEYDLFDYEEYGRSGTEFYATVTNCNTGEAEYMLLDDVKNQMDVIRASASLPFMSRKVMIGGVPYLDGGISDNIPLGKCQELGCDKIIVVLTHPRGYLRTTDSLTPLSKILYPSCKNLQKAFAQRNAKYNERIAEIERLEQAGSIVVLQPSRLVEVSRLEMDPEKLRALHALGVEDAENNWDLISSYLLRV